MERSEIEYNKHSNKKEIERALTKRDRERYSEELSELEREEAIAWGGLFWGVGQVIFNLITLFGFEYWVTTYPKTWMLEYSKIIWWGEKIWIILPLLTILWKLWIISSNKKKIVKIKDKLNRTEKDLSRDF